MNEKQFENYKILESMLEDEFKKQKGFISLKAKYITLLITKYDGEIVTFNIIRETRNNPNTRMFVENFAEDLEGKEIEEYYIHFEGEEPLRINNVLWYLHHKYLPILD